METHLTSHHSDSNSGNQSNSTRLNSHLQSLDEFREDFWELHGKLAIFFTFRVWSEPNGRWQDGQEFIRNVVRKRDKDEISPPTMPDQNLDSFWFKRKYRTRKRKKGTEFVYQIRDVPEGDLESNPVACSTTGVERAMASGEEGVERAMASGEKCQRWTSLHLWIPITLMTRLLEDQ